MKKTAGIVLFFLALDLFLLHLPLSSVSAQAWWFGKNKVQYKDFEWQILKTPHFDIHFNQGYRDLAGRTGVVLEYGYGKLSVDLRHHISWRIPVILYGSHSDFQQTNTTWQLLPEGVQAFAEPSRRRVVLHFNGSNVDFSHTAIHELVHIFQFDIIYGSLLRSVFSRNMLFNIPLWFAEGTAEYFSAGGVDDECRMFMRDGTIFDYLPYDLNYAGGYMNYKAGQSAISYIAETYGKEKVIELMDQLRFNRSMEMSLHRTIGISTEELTKNWKNNLRREYWPEYADKMEAESIARKVTDHLKKHNYINSKPVFSPDGEYIAYYSDRSGLEGIYIMDSVTGKKKKKLLVGSTSSQFEYIRTRLSSLTWNPESSEIAFVAKSDGRDRLFRMGVPGGNIIEEIDLPLDFFFNPVWSPDGEKIIVVGTLRGQTDLFFYDLGMKKLFQVTDDTCDEKYPAWFPDGKRIVYTRYPEPVKQPVFTTDSTGVDRIENLDYADMSNVLSVKGDIWMIDILSGEKRLVISTPGNDESPQILSNGLELLFVSDESGISNLYRGSFEIGSYHRFTDILGGLFNPSVSNVKDRLVFSAFNAAGYDLFIMDNFEEKSRVSYSTGGPLLAGIKEEKWPSFGVLPEIDPYGGSGLEGPDPEVERITVEEKMPGSPDGKEDQSVDTSSGAGTPQGGRFPGRRWENGAEVPDVVINEDSKERIDPDSLEALRESFRKRVGTVEKYRIKFSPDYIGNGMGVYFATGLGFGLSNQIAFSDLLGDHHLFLAFSLYGSVEDSDMMLSYYYVKKRIDYSLGIFQFKNYLNSRFSSVGETFLDYRYFTERNYGLFGNASFPFSTFTRAEMELQAYMSEREFLILDDGSYYGYTVYDSDVSVKRMLQPSFSIVHDSAYYGSFGPVIGSRWMLSFSRALSFSGRDISRTTAFLDYRRYRPLFYRNYLAFRTVASSSNGEDRRYFFLGGPTTMRGYDYLQFQGSRMMLFNLEYRYPLVDAIIFGWPGRWALTNIGGTLFFDTGSVWGDGRYIEKLPAAIDPVMINDLEFYSDFGVGFYMRMGFLIFNFQLAWPTDFSNTGEPVFHFYLGPQF
ncbi:MAG: PD40 domain-containing protein [Candidatus Krumholzibacteriota bacterium]|nr:PD40 domain-containing protein [Candidatus Krumholzibacteriota bacterium]